jgi:hypothetical protein
MDPGGLHHPRVNDYGVTVSEDRAGELGNLRASQGFESVGGYSVGGGA